MQSGCFWKFAPDTVPLTGARCHTKQTTPATVGGAIDGGGGAYFANYGDDVHAVGTLARSSRATSAAL
jgi:hypothetical protein